MSGLSKDRRDNLRRVLKEVRNLAEDAYRARLKAFGIRTECERDHRHLENCYLYPPERLGLSPKEKETRKGLEEAIQREVIGFGDLQRQEGLQRAATRYLQGAAFTLVNRLTALRAMEARGFLEETVIRRPRYAGMSLREWRITQWNPGLSPDEVLRRALSEGFTEGSKEIGMLFNPDDPYALLLPDPKPLMDLIQTISGEVHEEDWLADDIVGWVYQYYNEEARKSYRAGRGKGPRKAPDPDDIPIINQLYTPHWVVRVLVDNTLGRLWLEMTGRCPKLGDKLPPRTVEQLMVNSGESVDEFCSYLVSLLGEPSSPNVGVAVPGRPKKHPREIKILDPACGSGHFLIYAFDVLWRIWREAEPQMLPEEIAASILADNLYGIDIDLRACQLAALGLYLKAKAYAPGLKIRRLNIVCADARILDGARKAEFLAQFDGDQAIKQAVAKLLEAVGYTFELGSLLKVRSPIEAATQVHSFRRSQRTKIPAQDYIPGLSPATAEKILESLRTFEEQAMERRDMGSLLFASDTERSVGLLSILSERYDIILMNPPYGEMPGKTKKYLKEHYPKTHQDLYAAFIEQALDIFAPDGYIGMLTNLTFMYLGSYRWLRKELLHPTAPPRLIMEYGQGILDGAAVYTAGTVLRKAPLSQGQPVTFLRLTKPPTEKKEQSFQEVLATLWEGRAHHEVFWATLEDLAQVPGTPYAYWASPSLRALFTRYPPLDRDVAGKSGAEKIADVKQGLETADNDRFLRRWWEVLPEGIGSSREETFQGKPWVPFAKGEEFARYYADLSLVVNWGQDGEEVKNFRDSKGKLLSRPQNEAFYFREGLTWQRVSGLRLTRTRYLPSGCIFGANGSCIFTLLQTTPWPLLSNLNSHLLGFLMRCISPERVWQVGEVASLPTSSDILKSNTMESLAYEAHDLLREWDIGNEISTVFIKPWLAQVAFGLAPNEKPATGHPFARRFRWAHWPILKEVHALGGSPEMSLVELARICLEQERRLVERLSHIQRQIDEEIYELYEISPEDRALIERELVRGAILAEEEKGEIEETGAIAEHEEITEAFEHVAARGNWVPPEIRRLFLPFKSPVPVSEDEGIREHIRRLLSWYARRALEATPDGITLLNEAGEYSLLTGVRRLLVKDFGIERTRRLEEEIYEILGISLAEWLADEYFPYHVRLYKNRPIFWLLSSSGLRRGRSQISRPAFACFLDYRKLTRDTLPKVRGLYLTKTLDRARAEADRLSRQATEARMAKDERKSSRLAREAEGAREILQELEVFNSALEELSKPRPNAKPPGPDASWLIQKIAEVRDNGYSPNSDYGVLVNITPLKEAKVLHPAADRVK